MTRTIWTATGAALASSALLITSVPAETFASASALPAASASQPRSAVDLRPKFEEGQQQRYRLELQNTSWAADGRSTAPGRRQQPPAQGGGGQTHDARSTVEFGLLFRTKDLTEGIATVDVVIETVKLKLQAQEMEIEFDSTAPASSQDDLVGMMLQSIVGSTMTLKIDREGNIQSITGGEALAGLGQVGMPGAGGGQLFGNIFTVKGTAGMVSVGESWETESRVDSGLLSRFTMKTRHTLTRMQGNDAIITMRGRYELDSQSGGGGNATIKESNYSGNYTWDTAAGSLKEMNSSMMTVAERTIGEETVETRNESVVKVVRQR